MAVKFEFKKETREYFLNGKRIPSVTEIVAPTLNGFNSEALQGYQHSCTSLKGVCLSGSIA
ncbi:MAG: hypothetical protein LBT58_01770 [Endomicrobium sp.]|jgi:hypothetical protein|nr:hypothetical protein [Endomicrobium sp.]